MNVESKTAGTAKHIADNHVIADANKVIDFARQQNFLFLFVKIDFNQGYLDCSSNFSVFGDSQQPKTYS